jgi:hypothetical protein
LLPGAVYNLRNRPLGPCRSPRRWGMDDSEFLQLLTHIHDEMLELVKEQHPSHEQFAAWLLGQIEGRLRMRIGTVKTP